MGDFSSQKIADRNCCDFLSDLSIIPIIIQDSMLDRVETIRVGALPLRVLHLNALSLIRATSEVEWAIIQVSQACVHGHAWTFAIWDQAHMHSNSRGLYAENLQSGFVDTG